MDRKVELVHVTLDLFVGARISFRAVSRVWGVGCSLGVGQSAVSSNGDQLGHPALDRSTPRGGNRAQNPLSADPFANGFIWIVDISIALGSGKLLAVLALDARHYHWHASAPGLDHVRPLAVAVAESWTGDSVATVLKALIRHPGTPRALLKDGAANWPRLPMT